VPVTSLTATPILRSPTSSPATRPTSYNSRIPRTSSFLRPAAATCGVLALTAALAAAQAPPSSPDNRGQVITDRIRALQREADRLAGEARTLVGDLRKLEIERDLKTEQAKQATGDAATAQDSLRQTTDRLASLELQRLAQLPDMKEQLVGMYKRGRSGYAGLLFDARDLREFARAARAVASLATINQKRMEDHRRTLDALRRERAAFAQRAKELQARDAAARQARTDAERAVAARSARMAEIDSRRDLTAQYVGELQVAYDKIQQQLNASEGRREAVSVPLLPFRGALEWPVAGRLGSRFGQSEGRLGGSAVKNGIEIASTEDLPVRAVHGGTVAYADAFTGLGTLVILDHGSNSYSLYGYLGSMTVQMGVTVEPGAEIGRVGASPAGPPVLYFELRIDGKPTDPVQWLKPR
jgi:septal ring factor EnvC (AmiA/AmiB activator)